MCSDLCGNSNVYWDFRCPEPPLELHHPNRFQTKKLDTTLNIIVSFNEIPRSTVNI